MPLYPPRPTFATVLRSFAQDEGLTFGEALSEQDIQDACDAEGVHFGQDPHAVYFYCVPHSRWLTRWGARSLRAL
jgi:hypothetical protein